MVLPEGRGGVALNLVLHVIIREACNEALETPPRKRKEVYIGSILMGESSNGKEIVFPWTIFLFKWPLSCLRLMGFKCVFAKEQV